VETLLDLTHLGPLQTADLHRQPLRLFKLAKDSAITADQR
jgi:hypothetical protein